MRYTKRLHIWIFVALLCITFGFYKAYTYEENSGELSVYFLDIGQGDSAYIRTPGGYDMLIDGGPSKVVLEKLKEVMPWYDKRIDVVVATHPDADHIGGLPHVLKRYGVGLFIEPGIESKNVIDDEVRRINIQKNITTVLAKRGMRINFHDGSYFEFLYPDKDVSGEKDTNSASIIGQMKYASTSIMFTGDAPKSVENYLVRTYGNNLASGVLKAGHHGSRTSSEEGFVKLVSPDYVIISAGKNNRYGHPHKEVVDLFNSLGVRVYRTAELGTVRFVSDGVDFLQK